MSQWVCFKLGYWLFDWFSCLFMVFLDAFICLKIDILKMKEKWSYLLLALWVFPSWLLARRNHQHWQWSTSNQTKRGLLTLGSSGVALNGLNFPISSCSICSIDLTLELQRIHWVYFVIGLFLIFVNSIGDLGWVSCLSWAMTLASLWFAGAFLVSLTPWVNLTVVGCCMVARAVVCSLNGLGCVTPLFFVLRDGYFNIIWLFYLL